MKLVTMIGRDLVDTIVIVTELRRRLIAFVLIVDDKPGLVAGDADLAVFDRTQAVGNDR